MISVLKFFRIVDGQLAIFNDHDYVPSIKIENVIKKGRGRNNKIPLYCILRDIIGLQKINSHL